MGFFREWLHYQEVDQQLRAQLAVCQEELAQIQRQTEALTRDTSYSSNTLLQVLIAINQQQTAQTNVSPSQAASNEVQEMPPIEYDRERLEKQLSAYAAIDAQQSNAEAVAGSTIRRGRSDLTDPQLKIPWWLRSTFSTANKDEQGRSPVDQQSRRTDALVQRWFARWGNQVEEMIDDQEEQKS
jgi:hypothetical protein